MQKTANQIKSSFETLASGHYQIHSFLYAQEFEQQAYENLIYPLMLVYPLGGNLSGTTYSRNYRVIIADRVLKSEANELEVESDTQLIALDVLAYWMKMGQNERFTITSSNTITPFWEKWGDEVTGHFVDIGIEEFYDFNSCAIPLSGSIPTPPNPCKDARISVNSVVYGNAPSDSNFNVVVKNQSGALVGTLIGGEWIVNTGSGCADANYTIEDSLGNVLYSGTIPSGGSLIQAINNSTLNVNKSDGSLISSRSILAEDTDSYNVADSIAVIKNSAGTTLKSENILATASENITINDSVAVIKDSANLTLKSENILAEASENIVINDSLVNVRKSDNVLINAVNVKAENTENYLVADSTITNDAISPTYSQLVKATEGLILPTQEIQNNGVASGFIPSVGTINVTTNVAPTSFNISGRTIDIVVPTGASPMNVDFIANKLTAAPLEDITFTDLSDQSPTHWSWQFSDGTNSIVQNPVKSFTTLGFKNVTLMAGKVGAGGVNIKNAYIEIIAAFFTDLFGIPAAAYSLRKLSPNSTYSGAAIRVRRSSDNAEQDINFVSNTANSPIDTTALLSFVGGGNGFVVTWYNQNGSVNHVTQSTAANQPQIVSSGSLILENSKPSVQFDGTNDSLLSSVITTDVFTNSSIFSVLKIPTQTSEDIPFGFGQTGSNGRIRVLYSSNGQKLGFATWGIDYVSSIDTISTNIYLYSVVQNGASISLRKNTTTATGSLPSSPLSTTSGAYSIGSLSGSLIASYYTQMNGSEFIFFGNDQSVNRTAIELNINDYYNVF